MKSFSEFNFGRLIEMSIAMQGNMEDQIPIDYYSSSIIYLKYENKGTVETENGKKFSLFKLIGSGEHYKLGFFKTIMYGQIVGKLVYQYSLVDTKLQKN
jgi:hypothetical protein